MPLDFANLLSRHNVATEELIIDCKSIKIAQNRESEPNLFEASGPMVVNFRTGITARIVVYEANSTGIKDVMEFVESVNMSAGSLYPASRYYSLTATDADGNEWTNPVVEVAVTRHPTCTVALMKCKWIRCASTRDQENDSARMLFIDELALPRNVSKFTKVSMGGRNVDSHERAGSTGSLTGASVAWARPASPGQFSDLSIACERGQSLPTNFVPKLLESIMFVTASRVAPCVTEIVANRHGVVELSVATPLQPGLIQPPLTSDPQTSEAFYSLLDAYLIDAIKTSENDEFSPISAVLFPLFSTGSLSLNALALLLSVAIESLVQSRFKTLAAAPAALKAEVALIDAAISTLEISEPTKLRARGSLGGMKSSRADDKLHELSKSSDILPAEIATWKSLRNTSAHGALHMAPDKYQEALDKVYTANLLLNKVVMSAIGYKGPYKDYSKRGWPLVSQEHEDVADAVSEGATEAG